VPLFGNAPAFATCVVFVPITSSVMIMGGGGEGELEGQNSSDPVLFDEWGRSQYQCCLLPHGELMCELYLCVAMQGGVCRFWFCQHVICGTCGKKGSLHGHFGSIAGLPVGLCVIL